MKCGCLENTACSNFGVLSYVYNCEFKKADKNSNSYKAMLYWKKELGLKEDEEFGEYCMACSPIWYTKEGNYGIGPNPKPDAVGKWHKEFDRIYLPKGMFYTNDDGNLAHKVTGDTDILKYALKVEKYK